MSLTRRSAIRNFLTTAAAAPGVLRGARRPGEKPNLLFLWTDQQRASTLAVHGNYRFRVPVMNDLASRSIVFRRCYDTQPVCTPARSTVMSGLWPHQNGCLNNNIPLPGEVKVFPELLGDSSYRTGYMGKWHLGNEVFAQHGFQEWASIEDTYNKYFLPGKDRKTRSSYHHFLVSQSYKPDEPEGSFSRSFAVQRPVEHGKPAFLASQASDFIMRHRAEPWMLYVNFLEPHPPYFGPFNDLLSTAEAPMPPNYPGLPVEREPESYAARRKEAQDIEKQTLWKPPANVEGKERLRANLQRLNLNYAGNCSHVDRSLGKILWTLEASGQAENTIIVFTSDHGEMGGAHTLIQKSVMYEEALHVPLLLRVPFRHSGQISVERPVSHIGIVPTLLELMQGRGADALPGESLVGSIEGEPLREDHIFLEWNDVEGGPSGRTVISPDGWKLVVHDKDHGLLFHRDRDPLEMSNLYYRPESAPVISRLRKKLEEWQRRTGDKLALPDRLI